MAVANTLAYYDTATITAVKSFLVQASALETKYQKKSNRETRFKGSDPGDRNEQNIVDI